MYTHKRLLLAGVLGVLASSGAWAADSDSDSQDVTVTVPQIRLIDVSNAPLTCTLVAPVEAGTNFGNGTVASSYAITANSNDDGTAKNKIDVSVNKSFTVSGFNLKVLSTVPSNSNGTASSAVTLSTTDQTLVDSINETVDLNVSLTYTCGTSDSDIAPAYTSETVTVTYTIVDDV